MTGSLHVPRRRPTYRSPTGSSSTYVIRPPDALVSRQLRCSLATQQPKQSKAQRAGQFGSVGWSERSELQHRFHTHGGPSWRDHRPAPKCWSYHSNLPGCEAATELMVTEGAEFAGHGGKRRKTGHSPVWGTRSDPQSRWPRSLALKHKHKRVTECGQAQRPQRAATRRPKLARTCRRVAARRAASTPAFSLPSVSSRPPCAPLPRRR